MEVKVNNVSYLVEESRPNPLVRLYRYLSQDIVGYPKHENMHLLLQNVSATIKHGTVTVILGLGRGPASFLDCVSLRRRNGFASGKIQYDGSVRKNGIYKDISIIEDFGVKPFDSLTVFDYLCFGARLRLSHGLIECRERARLSGRAVGLDGSTPIGKLSRSETRLLSIAAELVANPTLICMRDPVEGLDAGGTMEVMRVIWNVSRRTSLPTTVLYSTSSVNEDMFRTIDNVAVFVENRLEMFYSLKSLTTAAHVNEFASALHSASNIVIDHKRNILASDKDLSPVVNESHAIALAKVIRELLQSISADSASDNGDDHSVSSRSTGLLAVAPTRSSEHISASRKINAPGNPLRQRKSLYKEVVILVTRSLKYHIKNVSLLNSLGVCLPLLQHIYLRMGLIRFVIAGVILGVLVSNDGSHLSAPDLVTNSDGLINSNAYNVTSALYVLVAMSVIGTAFAVPYLHENATLLKFEVASGLQTTFGSWLSLVLIDLPMYFLASLIIGGVVYAMVDIQGSASNYFGAIVIVTFTGYSLAAVCGIWFHTKAVATFMFAVLASFCLLFTGYLQLISQLPGVWVWASDLVFTRWAFESFQIIAFSGAEDGADYLKLYSFSHISASRCNGYILVWFILLQLLVLYGLQPPSSKMPVTADDGLTGEDIARQLHAASTLAADKISDYLARNTSKSSNISQMSAPGVRMQTVVTPGEGSSSGSGAMTEQNNSRYTMNPNVPALKLDELQPQIVAVANHMLTTLSFYRIKYVRENSKHEALETKLYGVSGTVTPGSSCCIIDGAHDGTSRLLLHILATKSWSVGKITGVICANDQRIGRSMHYLNAAYVQRGDVSNVSSLTVREVIRFAVFLRQYYPGSTTPIAAQAGKYCSFNTLLERFCRKRKASVDDVYVTMDEEAGTGGPPPGAAPAQQQTNPAELWKLLTIANVEQRVADVISMMGLAPVADSIVGVVYNSSNDRHTINRTKGSMIVQGVIDCVPWFNDRQTRHVIHSNQYYQSKLQSITPAQLRCLTIGVELVTQPGLVFLEDPTGDLEWQDAEQVAKVIAALAQGGRTVLCNIEKPSLPIFNTFSDVLLLGSGRIIYSGPTETAPDYFDNIGYERGNGQNGLEYIQDIAADRGKMALIGGKRGNALSPADLSDLNRSLSNIKAGKNKDFIDENAFEVHSDDGGELLLNEPLPYTPQSSFTLKNKQNPMHQNSTETAGSQNNSRSSSPKPSHESLFSMLDSTSYPPGAAFTSTPVKSRSAEVQKPSPKHAGGSRFAGHLSSNPSLSEGGSSTVMSYQAGRKKTTAKGPQHVAVIATKRNVLVGPTTFVLLRRGFYVLYNDKKLIVTHCLRCIAAGILVGSVWWMLANGDYQERVSLFAATYMTVNLFIVDSLEGVYRRKDTFLRESMVDASAFVPYYLSDTAPTFVLFTFGCLLFVGPVYFLANLRGGFGYFLYYFAITLASIYCNFSLAYILSMLTNSLLVCKMVYSGVVLPLQILMSGYLVLISTLDSWLSWGAYINPMMYYMAGCFRNEFEDNGPAMGEGVDYTNLSDLYSYHASMPGAIFAVLVIGVIYKLIWLLLLKLHTVLKRRSVMRRVHGVRKKARKLISAGLRWSEQLYPDVSFFNTTSAGIHGTNAEDEAYSELEFGTPYSKY